MIVEVLVVGRTTDAHIEHGIALYMDRLKHYGRYSITVIEEGRANKNLTEAQIKMQQGEQILLRVGSSDYLVLLDEAGIERTSEVFARWWQGVMNRGLRRVVFVVGGAYGFSTDVYGRADERVSLSKMTFSHQMVRLFFVEQLYRAHTILCGQPYHHS